MMMMPRLFIGSLLAMFVANSCRTVDRSQVLHGSESHAPEFSLEGYIGKCGGKYYAHCDKPDLNQVTIFNEAYALASRSKRPLIVIAGGEWCHTCVSLAKSLRSGSSESAELKRKAVLVSIYSSAKSAKDVYALLEVKEPEYMPAIYLVTSGHERPQTLGIVSDTTVLGILTYVNNTEAKTLTQMKEPANIRGTTADVFSRPIAILEGIGRGYLADGSDESAILTNQGVALLNAFQFVDAIRSFRTALNTNKNNVKALIGLIISYMELDESGLYYAMQFHETLKGILQSGAISESDRIWSRFAIAYLAGKSGQYQLFPDAPRSPDDVIETLKQAVPNNPEVMALATYLSFTGSRDHDNYKIDSYKRALTIDPKHTGALHYWMHHMEGSDEASMNDVLDLSRQLAEAAPNAPHLQHMLGHTLARMHNYAAAEAQFERAHQIHLDWANDLGVSPFQDWHFQHNGELYGHVLFLNGQLDRAFPMLEETGNQTSAFYLAAALGLKTRASALMASLESRAELSAFLQYRLGDRSQATIQGITSEYGDESELTSLFGDVSCQKKEEHLRWASEIILQIRAAKGFDVWTSFLPHLLMARHAVDANGCDASVRVALDRVVTEIAPAYEEIVSSDALRSLDVEPNSGAGAVQPYMSATHSVCTLCR